MQLAAQLTSILDASTQMQEQLSATSASKVNAEALVLERSELLKDTVAQFEALQRAHDDLQANHDRALASASAAQKDTAAKLGVIAARDRQVEELQGHLRSQGQELSELASGLQAVDAELTSTSSRKADLERQLRAAQADALRLSQELQASSTAARQQQGRAEQATADAQALRLQIQELERAHAEVRWLSL